MSYNLGELITKIRRVTGTNENSYSTDDIIFDINVAQDDVCVEILRLNGWNVDDYNHEKYPIITIDLVAGQRDYTFVKDQQGNFILNIYRVMAKTTSGGSYVDLEPVDQQGRLAPITLVDGNETQGTPTVYDKTANGIFLDYVPNESITDGLKIFIDREFLRFDDSDMTRYSGIDPLCHDYLYLKPAYEWLRDNDADKAERYFRDMNISWQKIGKRYGAREKDVVKRMIGGYQNNH